MAAAGPACSSKIQHDSSYYGKEDDEDLLCPIYMEPLIDAVSVWPCNHNISEAAARAIGNANHNGSYYEYPNQNIPCPECRTKIIGFGPDHKIRKLAQKFLAKQSEKKAKESEEKASDLSSSIPFPGKSAKFRSTIKWKENLNTEIPLQKSLSFKSQSLDSFVISINVLGYKDGEVWITVEVTDEDKFLRYLEKIGISIKDHNTQKTFFFAINQQCKTVFEALAQNNKFEDKEYKFVKNLLEAGDWRKMKNNLSEEKLD